ncbi:MAG TPA: uroporphyrinogen decarboxylase family protein [Anaerolineales bacterium]
MSDDLSMRERVLAVLRGELPGRLPFITRLEAWYKGHARAGTLPAALRGLTLQEVHARVGIGRLKFSSPFALRLRGVEVQATFDGQAHFQAYEPIIENFPGMWDIVPTDRAGETVTQLITPRGRLMLRHRLLAENLRTGTDPYLVQHLLQGDEDFPVLEYILERAEVLPLQAKIREDEALVGDHGLVVPLLYRIPFQQVLLEYLGEVALFRGLHDSPAAIRRLMDLLDRQMMMLIEAVEPLDVPYIEFPDNLHGPMTSPRLFREFCLPAYQKYCAALHAQGKKVGSHTDGNMRPLLDLLPHTGLDVCESFSPYPLTPCTFEEAWRAWEGGPLIWGAIPSPILEDRFSLEEYRAYLANLFRALDRPIILGITDLFMVHNSIERAMEIAARVEAAGIARPEENPLEI